MYDIVGLVLHKVRTQHAISIPEVVIQLVRSQYYLILLQQRTGWPMYNKLLGTMFRGQYSYSKFEAFREIMENSNWEHKHVMSYNNSSYQYAVINEHIPILQHLITMKTFTFTVKNMIDCAFYGSTNVLEFLYERYPEAFETRDLQSDSEFAATNGWLNVLQWLLNKKMILLRKNFIDHLIERNYLPVIKFLSEHKLAGCTTYAMDSAAGYGYIDILKWLHFRGERCTKNAIDNAAMNGQLDVVKWLRENRTEGCTKRALYYAVSSGRLDIVQYLIESGLVTDRDAINEEREHARFYLDEDVDRSLLPEYQTIIDYFDELL